MKNNLTLTLISKICAFSSNFKWHHNNSIVIMFVGDAVLPALTLRDTCLACAVRSKNAFLVEVFLNAVWSVNDSIVQIQESMVDPRNMTTTMLTASYSSLVPYTNELMLQFETAANAEFVSLSERLTAAQETLLNLTTMLWRG